MYITINSVSHFMDEFNRMHRRGVFSYEAFEALFEYYNELDDYELDVTEICHDWVEYDTLEEVLETYNVKRFEKFPFAIELGNDHVLVRN